MDQIESFLRKDLTISRNSKGSYLRVERERRLLQNDQFLSSEREEECRILQIERFFRRSEKENKSATENKSISIWMVIICHAVSSHSAEDDEQHLWSLGLDSNSDSDMSIGNDSDSSVEVVFSIDDPEQELVSLSNCLRIQSEVDVDDDNDDEWPQPPSPLSSLSSDAEESNDPQQLFEKSGSDVNGGYENCAKRKRRQWSVKEKLDAVAAFEAVKNKRQMMHRKGCTAALLRKWIREKDQLMEVCRKKKGKLFLV